MRKPSRFIAFLMAMVMIFTLLPAAAFAADDPFTMRISSETAAPGNEVQVKLSLENNPGIASIKIKVAFGSELTLTNVEFNSAELGGTATPPQKLTSPVTLSWVRPTQGNYYGNSLFATLTFTVNKNALGAGENEKVVAITATYDQDNVYNEKEQNVPMTVVDGQVRVTNYVAGDINGDGVCNQKDLTRLYQFYADWDVWVNWPVMDVNGDDSFNQKDLTRLAQFSADWEVDIFAKPGYWPTEDCEHTSLTLQNAKAATCISEGNIAYYKCDECGRLFADAEATTPITLNEAITAKDSNNHADVRVIPATETSTEGSKCEACGVVIVEPKAITPEPNTNSITYHIVDEAKHPYLGTLNIDTSSLKYSYTPGQAFTLTNLDLGKYGYTFNGWYDGFGDNATQIKVIPATANEDIELFAHVTEIVYDITYNTYQTPVTSKPTEAQLHYTVSKGNSNLYNPEINNYKFLGWYDNNGVEYKTIPIGTTGNIVLNTYYTSLRNIAVSKADNNPLILEDRNNNVVYFTYEIGEIRNIPLNGDNPFWTVQSVAGLSQQKSEIYTTTTSSTEASSISKTISDMTVMSNTSTLSESWNDVTTVNESWAESIGKTTEQCKTEATTSSNTLSISDQMGGSSYHKTEDGTTVYDYDSKTETKDKGHTFDASLSGSYANKMGANFGESNEYGTEASYSANNAYSQQGKITADNWSASGSSSGSQSGSASVSDKDKYSSGISFENGFEVNAGLNYGYHNNTNTVTKTGSDSVTVNSTIDENTGTWNSSATSSYTNQHSVSQSVRNTLSDVVTTTKDYGKSYSKGGTDSTTQGFSSTASNTSGTTSTVTYSKLESKTTTSTYSVDGHIEGRYRCILVGKAHVFAVVGYDYNTNSYFTYTFSVMDDKVEEFLDYTPKGADFDDCENSCLPFEIPITVFEYVNERTASTNNIVYKTNSANGTATIIGFEGASSDVIAPSYISDGKQAYKVTDISSSAFAGKPVRAVVLGEFIKSIPDGAFKNCTQLEAVLGSFTEIGKEAFYGCNKLSSMNIPSNVVKIGLDAFKGVNSINVRAVNSLSAYAEAAKALPRGTDKEISEKQIQITQDLIQAVLNSGAQNITLDISNIAEGTPLTLTVPEISTIEINGGSKKYHNISINSAAKETLLSEITIENSFATPLKISSDKLTLKKVSVSGDTTSLVLRKDGAVISLIQDSTIQSTSKYAVICKNPTVVSQKVGSFTGSLSVVGILGYVNSIKGDIYVDGTKEKISETEFANYEKGIVNITLDPNGGSLGQQSETKSVVYGEKLGTLPTPSRDYYDFLGWFDKAEGGNKITSESIVSGDMTLYAHWKATEYNVTFDVNGGDALSVSGKKVVRAGTYGELPTPTRTGYSFTGWYITNATGGETKVASDTIVTTAKDHTLVAHWSVNNYTYTILYKSSNGTNLGSSSATYAYGTTNTIYPPAKSGYNTPGAQTVKWDSTSGKTITFTYSVASVDWTYKSGRFSSAPVVDYNARIEYRNRTASSVEVRVVWTSTIKAYNYTVYGQQFYMSSGNGSNTTTLCSAGTWNSSVSYDRSASGTSGWVTVPLSTTNRCDVGVYVYYYQTNYNGTDMTKNYGDYGLSTTWYASIPAY